jgi:hypothetical protein
LLWFFTDRFVNEALEVAKNPGIPDPPLVIIGHPFATLNSMELDNLVEKYFGAVVKKFIYEEARLPWK